MDGRSRLAADVDAAAVELRAAGPLADFPREGAFYGDARQGMDLLVDREIIHYAGIGGPGGQTLLGCARGFNRTAPAPHRAGATIHHLCERYGSYLVDLRTSLKDELAERVAGVFNRCGFDMIYFDGGECNMANGPYWYWVSQQQMAVYDRMRRDVLVQGSGGTPWTWHIFARGCCDDFAAVAPKQYLDLHKIADSWRSYTDSFMPAELGWWGFLEDTPHNPATSPDEVEYYAVRMLALDTPVSLETNLSALKRNGRTEELLELLGSYERLRLANAVPAAVREKLRRGEWHMSRPGEGDSPIFADHGFAAVPGKSGQSPGYSFRPIRYDTQRVALPGEARAANLFACAAAAVPLAGRAGARAGRRRGEPGLAAEQPAVGIAVARPQRRDARGVGRGRRLPETGRATGGRAAARGQGRVRRRRKAGQSAQAPRAGDQAPRRCAAVTGPTPRRRAKRDSPIFATRRHGKRAWARARENRDSPLSGAQRTA